MTRLVVHPSTQPLRGSVPVPSDKSISHRALIFAALSAGACVLRGFSYGEDNVATLNAFRAMGVTVEDDGHGLVRVHGVGLSGLRPPAHDLDCGNSGTTMRLLCGLLCAQPFESRLVGDASLSRRPMGRVANPLRLRGATIHGQPHPKREGEITAPLVVGPLRAGERLAPQEYRMPIASAQVKTALLLAGLFASGPTLVEEPMVSRDHTERMMGALGLPIEAVGSVVQLHPPRDPDALKPFDIDLPGDLSAAAFLIVAAQIVKDSRVTVRHTGLNPTRSGILDIVRLFGGNLEIMAQGSALNEPVGEITASESPLAAGTVAGELSVRSIDEIPIAAALAARAAGRTVFADVAELRVKESDRVATVVSMLRDFGLQVEEQADGLSVVGKPGATLRAARINSSGDHRIAMTAAVLGLVADGPTVIEDAGCIATSFPRFVGTLNALGARLEVES